MSELVDKWEDKTAGDMTVWMHRKRSTGGRSVSPHPVVSKCRTCNGTGEYETECSHIASCECVNGMLVICPDCTAGWVTNLGTIRQRCAADRSLWVDDAHCNGSGHGTKCGLVLVIPIGDHDG